MARNLQAMFLANRDSPSFEHSTFVSVNVAPYILQKIHMKSSEFFFSTNRVKLYKAARGFNKPQ
jgi:hypothetical protein